MKTWDDWSDLEVNAQVTMAVYNLHGWEYSDNMQQFYHCGACGNETHNQPVINYCSSWSDMWPIIVDNGIGMVAENGKLIGATTSSQQYYEPYGDTIYSHDHANPLRAAAIVFIMMNGVMP